ncbi:MAG TPA: DUF551 domain-containing protein [Anaerolineae bacterium]|nr:DUF551 domain-containing protein [Anaerolineae bacterium]
MAFRDYIICRECKCKYIYDGSDCLRDAIEEKWGDPEAPNWTVPAPLCPDCDKKREAEIAALKADLAALREVEREKVAAWILSFGFATGHGDTIEDLLSEAGTQIQELRAAQEWVPVSERLPDNGVTVLIAGGCAYHLSHNGWFTLMGSDAHRRITWTVTHWMPLPLPPQPAQENAEDGV